MTPYECYVRHFVPHWQHCRACELARTRKQVVLARGQVPCQVVFVGEAPGRSEDALGEPFVGPAGHLLDGIIGASLPPSVSYALTNVVCCLPLGEEGEKNSRPPQTAIKACQPRLLEFIELCHPQLLIAVGAIARVELAGGTNLLQGYFRGLGDSIPFISIAHPAALLRAPEVQRRQGIHRCKIQLVEAVERFLT